MAFSRTKFQNRQHLIKSVHAAARLLALSQDDRHLMQQNLVGKASLTDMSDFEINKVLQHLNGMTKATKTVNAEWKFVFNLPEDRARSAKKIYKLCQNIGQLQSPPVPIMSKAWVIGIARQMKGLHDQDGVIVSLELLSAAELQKIVQALKIHEKRLESARKGGANEPA